MKNIWRESNPKLSLDFVPFSLNLQYIHIFMIAISQLYSVSCAILFTKYIPIKDTKSRYAIGMLK